MEMNSMHRRRFNSTIRKGLAASLLSCAFVLPLWSAALAADTDVRIVSGQEKQNGKLLVEMFDAFNARKTGVHVTLELDNKSDLDTTQKVMADIVSGSVPDAVRVTGVVLRAYVDSGRAQPLDACLDSAPDLKAQLDQGLLDNFRVNGKLYAMPWYTTLPALYINASAFRQAGLDPANPPKTWSELEADAAKLSDKGKGKFGILMYMPNTYLFNSQLDSAGGAFVGADGKSALDSPQAAEVMEFMHGLVAKGYMPAISPSSYWGEFAALFRSGNLGMMISSASAFPQMTGGLNFDVSLAPMPIKDGGSMHATASGNGFVMLATDPEKQKATCEALKTLVTPENVTRTVKATATVPLNTVAAEGADYLAGYYKQNPAMVAINKQTSSPWYNLPGKGNAEFQKAFGDTQFEVLRGEKSAKDAVKYLAGLMNELIADN
jgi:ABC-type glycerol-3-phosphate transport system substrate-binding protein